MNAEHERTEAAGVDAVFVENGAEACVSMRSVVSIVKLVTGTLTLDYRPSDYLILRLDNRIDWSNKKIFPKSVRDLTGVMPTTTLGVVVTTN